MSYFHDCNSWKKIGESSRVSRYICLIKIYQRACWSVKILRREDDDKWNVKKPQCTRVVGLSSFDPLSIGMTTILHT